MSNISSRPPPPVGDSNRQDVLVVSSKKDLAHRVREALKDRHTVKVRRSLRGFRNALAKNPGIVIIDADGDALSEKAVNHVYKLHNNNAGAYGVILLSERSNTEVGRNSGRLDSCPIITHGNLLKANGKWKQALDLASEKRMGLEMQIQRLTIGVVGYGRVGRSYVHSCMGGTGEPYNLKVISRNHDVAKNDIEQNFDLMKGRCLVNYNETLDDVLDSDMMFVSLKEPHGQRAKGTKRDSYWKENAGAIQRLGKKIQGYEGLVVMVTNLPEVNSFLLREAAHLEDDQVVALGNLDAIRVDNYANQKTAKHMLQLADDQEVYDCFVFGTHDKPVPGFSLMRQGRGTFIVDNPGYNKFVRSVEGKFEKELPHYIVNKSGNTDVVTGYAMIDVTKSVYDGRIVTLGLPYDRGMDSLGIPMQKPCVVAWDENGNLRVEPINLHPSEEESDAIEEARFGVIDYLSEHGVEFDKDAKMDPIDHTNL